MRRKKKKGPKYLHFLRQGNVPDFVYNLSENKYH